LIKSKKRFYVAATSILASCLILGLKWIAYALTDSTALKSDALEGVVNVVAGMFALGAIFYAEQPADKEHPYGHGKVEYFSAAFEGGLISLAAVLIIYEAIHGLLFPIKLTNMDMGLAINVLGGVLNGLLGWFLITQGRALNSEAISADGHHIITDFITTIGMTIGLLLVRFTGMTWIDPVIALLIGLSLARTGYKLVGKSSSALIDAQDSDQLEAVVAAINQVKTDDIITIHELRSMKSGRHTHVDMHIVVPEFYDIRRAHDFVENFGEKVLRSAGIDGEVHSHIDPCYRLYCRFCKIGILDNSQVCPIRKEGFQAEREITVLEAIKSDGEEFTTLDKKKVAGPT